MWYGSISRICEISSEANIKTNLDLAQEESLKNQDDVKFSMDDAEQSSFDKTAKRLGGQEAYL